VIKFDISLVKKLQENDRAGRVVADFARMMADAGYELVAEGVENEAVMKRVRELGFAHVQGYLLGYPQPLSEIIATRAARVAAMPEQLVVKEPIPSDQSSARRPHA